MTRLATLLRRGGGGLPPPPPRNKGGACGGAPTTAADEPAADDDDDDDLSLPPSVAADLLFGSLAAAARKQEKRRRKEEERSAPPKKQRTARGSAGAAAGASPSTPAGAGPVLPLAPPPDDAAAWAAAATAPDPADAWLASDLTAADVARLEAGSVPVAASAGAPFLLPAWGARARWVVTGPAPLPHAIPASPATLGLRPRVAGLWANLQAPGRRAPAFESPAQAALLCALRTYKDLLWPARPYPAARPLTDPDPVMDAYLVHIASHVVAAAARVRKGNERVAAAAAAAGDEGAAAPPRDQGFARPKALILLPTRAAARVAVLRLAALLQAENRSDSIAGKDRFRDDFGDDEEEGEGGGEGEAQQQQKASGRHAKPADFTALFAGNTDDHFRLGIRVTRGHVRLYADFETADIVVASPLGLATHLAAAAEDGPGGGDFLSSIEVAILDRADMAAMQNWAHVEAVFGALNRLPEKAPACDVMRVREAALGGWARCLRQVVLLGGHTTPALAALWSRHAHSAAGRARLVPSYEGFLASAPPAVQLTFERLREGVGGGRPSPSPSPSPSPAPASAPDARFAHFTSTVWPRIKAAGLPGQLLFVPSYFDYVRVKAFLAGEGVGVADLGEYVAPPDAARARTAFAKGTAAGGTDHALPRLALLTERAHFYHRAVLRGVRDVLVYQLPDHAAFYQEVVSWVGARWGRGGLGGGPASGGRAVALFSGLDALALERVAGSVRARRMLKGAEPAFVFC